MLPSRGKGACGVSYGLGGASGSAADGRNGPVPVLCVNHGITFLHYVVHFLRTTQQYTRLCLPRKKSAVVPMPSPNYKFTTVRYHDVKIIVRLRERHFVPAVY